MDQPVILLTFLPQSVKHGAMAVELGFKGHHLLVLVLHLPGLGDVEGLGLERLDFENDGVAVLGVEGDEIDC